ncbi:MAG: hypothetical protein HXX09_08685 [Bacteroidetes bacterium]|nr:hypothetical protein [Bacteroidota bacterium]
MQAIIISPKDKKEFVFISELLKKMEIKTKIFSEEEKEDFGLIELMKKVDRTKKVSREKIMSKLEMK